MLVKQITSVLPNDKHLGEALRNINTTQIT